MQIKTQDGVQDVAGSGTTALGIIGTVLGGAAVANSGLLGNLLGGGSSNQTNALMSELAREKAERFAEKTGSEIYNAMFAQYKELAQATTNIDKRVSALEVAGPLREQLLNQRIDCCCSQMSAGLAALQSVVASITKTVIPNSSVCPGWGDVTITPAAAPATGA